MNMLKHVSLTGPCGHEVTGFRFDGGMETQDRFGDKVLVDGDGKQIANLGPEVPLSMYAETHHWPAGDIWRLTPCGCETTAEVVADLRQKAEEIAG